MSAMKSKTQTHRRTRDLLLLRLLSGQANWPPPAPTARHQTSLGQRPRYRNANPARAESPSHSTAMRHRPPNIEECRTDAPRRWRSGIGCAVHMGRCPMLVLIGPLALPPTLSRCQRQTQTLRRTRDLLLPRLLSGQVSPATN
jgi:hypothetical protein